MRFDLAPMFSEEDFRHWFLPQSGIVDSFVVDNGSELTGEFDLLILHILCICSETLSL